MEQLILGVVIIRYDSSLSEHTKVVTIFKVNLMSWLCNFSSVENNLSIDEFDIGSRTISEYFAEIFRS